MATDGRRATTVRVSSNQSEVVHEVSVVLMVDLARASPRAVCRASGLNRSPRVLYGISVTDITLHHIRSSIHRRLAMGLVVSRCRATRSQAGFFGNGCEPSETLSAAGLQCGAGRAHDPASPFSRHRILHQRRYVAGATSLVSPTARVHRHGPQGVLSVRRLRGTGRRSTRDEIKVPGFEATNDVRYELVDNGRRLRATEQGRSPMGSHDAVWIYDRR